MQKMGHNFEQCNFYFKNKSQKFQYNFSSIITFFASIPLQIYDSNIFETLLLNILFFGEYHFPNIIILSIYGNNRDV